MEIKLATQEQLENVKSEIFKNIDGKIKEEIDKIPPINNATDISTGVVKIDKAEGEEAPHTVPTIGRLEEDMNAFGDRITADIQSRAVTSVAGRTGAVTVSKSDVGLSNITNEKQATKIEFDEHKAENATQAHKISNISGLQQAIDDARSDNVTDDSITFGGRFEWRYNEVEDSLDLVVIE